MMMTHAGSPRGTAPAERRRRVGCAVALSMLVCGAAAAQPAQDGAACVLATAQINPAAFARALARHAQALKGCELDAAGQTAQSRVPDLRMPSTVAVDPIPEAPAPVAPAPPSPRGGGPKSNNAQSVPPEQAFTERMRLLDLRVLEVARRNDIDPLLLHALIHVESRHRTDAVSPAGARGAMQVMPQTAARFGVQTTKHLHEPDFNLAAGAAYLKMLQGEFGGDLDLALAAYNAGEGAVRRHGGRIPPYPETQAYVRDVRAMYGRLRAERDAVGTGTRAPTRLAMSVVAR